jgi:hypothetical protein
MSGGEIFVPKISSVKIVDLAKVIGKKFQKKISFKRTSSFRGGTNIRCPNILKVKKLGFKAKNMTRRRIR